MLLFHDMIYPRLDPRVYKEAKSLSDMDNDVTVVDWAVEFTGEGRSIKNIPKYDCFENIDIKRIFQNISPYSRTIFIRIIEQLHAMLKLSKEAISEKPDVVHSHDLTTLLSGVIVKKRLKIPLIYDSHEYWPGMVQERNGPFMSNICKFFERIMLTQVDTVITVSGTLAENFKKHVAKTHIVYNSRKEVEMLNINEDEVNGLRKLLNISKDDFVVGYIGNINSKRGIDKLVKSFEHIKDENIKLLIVGGGERGVISQLKPQINHENETRIIFTGQIPYHEVLPYFSLLNVGCVLFQPLPNHSIAAPNKLFEYMSMGIPLLVSDLTEMRRIVTIDSKCGICVDATSPEQIADSIKWLHKNPEKTKIMGNNGLKQFKQKYCWENMEETLHNVYEDLK